MRNRLSQAVSRCLLALGLLAGCSESDAPDDELNPVRGHTISRIVPAGEAIAGAHLPTLDPMTMNDAEVEKALGTGPRCAFRYTSTGRPVLAFQGRPGTDPGQGVVKLNGNLVLLQSQSADGSLALQADEVRLVLSPKPGEPPDEREEAGRIEMDTVFTAGDGVKAGYRGYFGCQG